jgi:hypothetical protein
MRNLIRILCIFFLPGCVNDKNDVYIKYPKNSKLTKEILTLSEQIVIDKKSNFRIIIVNISDNSEIYSPHILFYDCSLKLISSSYLASEMIDSMKNKTLYGRLNENRQNRNKWFRNDLPNNLKLSLNKHYTSRKIGTISNKAINRFKINNGQVTLFVSKTNNNYEGLEWINNNSFSLNNFKIQDTLLYQLSQLKLNYKDHYVTVTSINKNNEIVYDKMIIPERKTTNSFYEQIWAEISPATTILHRVVWEKVKQ